MDFHKNIHVVAFNSWDLAKIVLPSELNFSILVIHFAFTFHFHLYCTWSQSGTHFKTCHCVLTPFQPDELFCHVDFACWMWNNRRSEYLCISILLKLPSESLRDNRNSKRGHSEISISGKRTHLLEKCAPIPLCSASPEQNPCPSGKHRHLERTHDGSRSLGRRQDRDEG